MKKSTTNYLEAGETRYARLRDGLVAIGPAVLPRSEARFWRGTARREDGVPLWRNSSAPKSSQEPKR